MIKLLLNTSDDVIVSRTIINSQLVNLTDPDPEPDTSDDDGGESGPGTSGGPGRFV